MSQDEAGFGRISKLGSCWSPIGVGPHVHSHYIREFRYCYGAVDAHTGESFFLIAGGCNTEWMNVFLEELSQAYPDDYLLFVMDNAIWHKSSTLKIPTNIGFTFIPPYTPEMNPIEQVLKEIRKRGFKNKAFLARHLKATEAGEFVTIDALFQAYKKELGRSYTRDAFYQLLKRHGWRNITPRPEHPRKADAQTIVASKNKISIQEDKKAL
ncbi:transposase family protein [Streptococcus pneumoniae]|nr:transposase family protein [Streptococcus pneumoniae]